MTAKTHRWKPKELLRTLVEAEIASCDESNRRARTRQAGFPVIKTLEEFDVAASAVSPATFDYLSSLGWIRAAEKCAYSAQLAPGSPHTLIGLGIAAVEHGHRVRYFTAAELVETLYRGLADNSVGKVIDTRLRNDLVLVDELGFAPLDDTSAQARCCSDSSRPPTNAGRSGSRSTGPSSPSGGSCPSTPPRSACSTGSCTTAIAHLHGRDRD